MVLRLIFRLTHFTGNIEGDDESHFGLWVTQNLRPLQYKHASYVTPYVINTRTSQGTQDGDDVNNTDNIYLI